MGKKLVYLSYFLDENTPLYGGEKGIEIQNDRNIENGDTANTKRLKLHNHSGTHIDFPNHFFINGKKSNDYSADFWIFEHPFVLHLTVMENEIITLDDELLNLIPSNTDFLIFNTGFYKIRETEKFWKNNPGVAPEVAEKLKQHCANLRVLAMDFISLTSYQNRELGRASHRAFLGEHQILLVEDVNLNFLHTQPSKIMCFPLLVNEIDGAPVTIIAEI